MVVVVVVEGKLGSLRSKVRGEVRLRSYEDQKCGLRRRIQIV